tara:strand:+ start:2075 stop:2335 length:261 start_codon:yes stop_codon:yes gene_type:complete
MTWEDILKDSNTDIAKILSKIFVKEYIQELLAKPNPKQETIKVLEDRIEDAKRTMETIVPYKILIEDYQKQIAEYKEAIEKIKSLR